MLACAGGRVLVFVAVFWHVWCVLIFVGVWYVWSCGGVCLQLAVVLLHFPERCRSSVHYVLSWDCGRIVFPSRSALRLFRNGNNLPHCRHCCHPPPFQMPKKSDPKVKNMKLKANAEHNRKAENTETCREKNKECQKEKSILLNKQSDKFLTDIIWFSDLFGSTGTIICLTKTFMVIVTFDVCEMQYDLRCISRSWIPSLEKFKNSLKSKIWTSLKL